MNDPLEHNVYKPVNISHPSCLVLFASYFCSGFNKFIIIKMPGALIVIDTLPNLMYSLTECYVYLGKTIFSTICMLLTMLFHSNSTVS